MREEMSEKKKELLKKLQALAERGVGGEKETAERKLRQLMEKYGMRMQQMMGAMQDKTMQPLLEAAD